MNRTSAFIHETPGGSYYAMVRLPMDAKARPVLGKGGEAIRYPDAYSAMKAANEAVCGWINGHMNRDGATLMSHQAEIAAVFRPGKKPIPVERKRA